MKFITIKSLQFIGRGMVASAVLATGIVIAADTPATSKTTKGAGASALSGNTEEAHSPAHPAGLSTEAKMPRDAKSFLRQALAGNSEEIALAEMAERKGQSAATREFAQMIRRDHQQANDKLQALAQTHGVTLNQPVDSKHQKKLDRFDKLSGTEFDREYAKEMLKDHQKDIARYEQAVQNITETDVREYAQTTLTKLRQHLEHARQTAQTVGVDSATISSLMKPGDSMGASADDSEATTGTGKSDRQPESLITP